MKKSVSFLSLFLLILVIAVSPLFYFQFFSCAEKNPLYNKVTELRERIYSGSADDIDVKATYGYKTENGTKKYCLNFYLESVRDDEVKRSISFSLGETRFDGDFTLSPSSGKLCASFRTETAVPDSIAVNIRYSSISTDVVLNSIIPEGTMTIKQVLDSITENQKNLVASYTDENGDFDAEIIARVTVKNEKSYWYVGIQRREKLIAFLLDGINGETLAVREVF